MGSGNSPASADISVLNEVAGAVRAEAHAERARGLPLKAAAPIIARRLGLPSPRRVLAYLHGEVAEDDVRAVELLAVRRAQRTVRALASDAAWAADIEDIKARLAAIESQENRNGTAARSGAGLVQAARRLVDGAL